MGDLAYKGGSGNIVQKVRTRVVPPVSGNWIFYISSDSQSFLYVSTDGTRFQKRMLSSAPGYTGIQEWTKFPSQKSVPVHLEAGQPYFVELVHQQRNTNAHFEIGWSHEPLNWCRMAGVTVSQSSQYQNNGPGNAVDGDVDCLPNVVPDKKLGLVFVNVD